MTDDVAAVKSALDALGPLGVLSALGVQHQREGRGARLCCPMHSERTPSATLSLGPQGSLRLHCFGACSRSWDAIALVAAVRGLDVKADFRAVLQEAADVAGVVLEKGSAESSEAFRRNLADNVSKVSAPPPPSYPPDAYDFWTQLVTVTSCPEASAYLSSVRALDPAAVARLDLARSLPGESPDVLPRWARRAGSSWAESGHRLVVPAYDAQGRLRSVRASRVNPSSIVGGRVSKRLAPAGHTCAGLVFAEPKALALLSNPEGVAEDLVNAWGEVRIVIMEGEFDFLTGAVAWPEWVVLGVFSGSWTADVAARIPDNARVLIATHEDDTGEKYAAQITETLAGRCRLERAHPATAADEDMNQ